MLAYNSEQTRPAQYGSQSFSRGTAPVFRGASAHAGAETDAAYPMYASPDSITQYLEGIRRLARKKRRRCISQEL